MKDLFKQYGSVIVVGLAAVLILGILMNININGKVGIYNILGNGVKTESEDYASKADEIVTSNVLATKKPELNYSGGVLSASQNYDIESLFTAVNRDGTPADITIESITDKDGNDLLAGYDLENYRFPTKGIYQIKVYARGQNDVDNTLDTKVPVSK